MSSFWEFVSALDLNGHRAEGGEVIEVREAMNMTMCSSPLTNATSGEWRPLSHGITT
jgi:hypothetical protein